MTRRTPEEIARMKHEFEEKKKASPYIKGQRKNLSAYLRPEILEKLKTEAKNERRSVNGQLCYILEKYFGV